MRVKPHEYADEVVQAIADETLEAVDVLGERELFTQALTVLYAAIEHLTWLATSEDQVTREGVMDWISKYLIPESGIGADAIDIYGARCGLVHQRLAGSPKSAQRGARDVFYVTCDFEIGSPRCQVGTKDENGMISWKEQEPAVRVEWSTLIAAFTRAVGRFKEDIRNDKKLRSWAQGRCHMLLGVRRRST